MESVFQTHRRGVLPISPVTAMSPVGLTSNEIMSSVWQMKCFYTFDSGLIAIPTAAV